MLAATVDDTCGATPRFVCRLVFERTENAVLSQFSESLVWVLAILALAWLLSRAIRRQIPRAVASLVARREADERKEEHDRELTPEQLVDRNLHRERARQRTETLGHVLKSVLVGVVWFIAILLILSRLGVNLAPLLAGAGVAGIALGFGAQQMVRDFLAGIFIVMEDQFGVGDVVDLGQATGSVERVNLRVTRLRDVDGVVWYVPNGEIRRVGNMSKLWSRAVLDIDVAYHTDVDVAGAALLDEATKLWREPLDDCTIIAEPEYWGVERFNADSVSLRLVVRTEPTEQWSTARELRARIKTRFDAEGIEFPFPQRTVWLRNHDEPTA